jgi:hypothetical protein
MELDRFGIFADGRPIRLGGRAFDARMALIEASGAVGQQGRARELRLAKQDRR